MIVTKALTGLSRKAVPAVSSCHSRTRLGDDGPGLQALRPGARAAGGNRPGRRRSPRRAPLEDPVPLDLGDASRDDDEHGPAALPARGGRGRSSILSSDFCPDGAGVDDQESASSSSARRRAPARRGSRRSARSRSRSSGSRTSGRKRTRPARGLMGGAISRREAAAAVRAAPRRSRPPSGHIPRTASRRDSCPWPRPCPPRFPGRGRAGSGSGSNHALPEPRGERCIRVGPVAGGQVVGPGPAVLEGQGHEGAAHGAAGFAQMGHASAESLGRP